MIIENISINNFRNLKDISFTPHRQCNIISGANAQGKTNILEAIWTLTGCKSFRGSKERDFMGFKKNSLDIKISFKDLRRVQSISYQLNKHSSKSKIMMLNGVELKTPQPLFEEFKCVVFTPDDIELIKGSPEKRRSFIDLCHSQLHHSSLKLIRRYDKILSQRNATLKDIYNGRYSASVLDAWDRQLAYACAAISIMRLEYVKKIDKCASELYRIISSQKERLAIDYMSECFSNEVLGTGETEKIAELYYDQLKNNMNDDIRLGYTRLGAHRDDIGILIDHMPIRDFGSQGQKKSAALVLKLAQATLLFDDTNEPPIILLDDVMGELDIMRQRLIFEVVEEMQVFITVCNENSISLKSDAKIFNIQDGRLV